MFLRERFLKKQGNRVEDWRIPKPTDEEVTRRIRSRAVEVNVQGKWEAEYAD